MGVAKVGDVVSVAQMRGVVIPHVLREVDIVAVADPKEEAE